MAGSVFASVFPHCNHYSALAIGCQPLFQTFLKNFWGGVWGVRPSHYDYYTIEEYKSQHFFQKNFQKNFKKSVDIFRLCGIMYIVKGTLVADHTGRAETSKQQKILSALK